VIVFAVIMLGRIADGERSRYHDEALDAARRSASAADRELSGLQSALKVLTTSRVIDARDYAGLYEQAVEG